MHRYKGELTAQAVAQFVNRRSAPVSRKASCQALGSRITDKLNLVYFGDFEGPLFDLHMQAANSNEVFSFFHAAGSCAE